MKRFEIFVFGAISFVAISVCAADVAPGVSSQMVQEAKSGAGWILNDANGMTLYTSDKDRGDGTPICGDNCMSLWLPLLAPESARDHGDISVIKRGSTRQWAYRGKGLYRYGKDLRPGDAFGDDFQHVWRVVFEAIPTPPEIKVGKTQAGQVLATKDGMTLYYRLRGAGCSGTCLKSWRPVEAPAIAVSMSDFTAVRAGDGNFQWAYQKRPLYVYRDEIQPHETAGIGIDPDWGPAILVPAPPNPAWVTVQNSDMGPVFADHAGLTLYSFSVDGDLAKLKSRTCDDECVEHAWKRVPVEPDAKDVGNWSIVSDSAGNRQWTYFGNPVFTHTQDTQPGDIRGDKFAGAFATTPRDGWWRPITPLDAHRSKQDKD